MASASHLSPYGRLQRDCPVVGMFNESPTRLCICQETYLQYGLASAGANHRNEPTMLPLTEQVDRFRVE
jgi:hypothetical protein